MTNNTDTKVPLKSRKEEDLTHPGPIFVGLLAFGLLAVVVFNYVDSRPDVREEPRPPLWTINATVRGNVAFGVHGLTMPHYLNVSMGNYDCGLGEDKLRCCHAEVAFDGYPDVEQARKLCNDLQIRAHVLTGDGVTGISSDQLDGFVRRDSFEPLYRQRFGGEPNDRRTSTTFVNHR